MAASPWAIPPDWPAPEPAARELGERLVEMLRGEIAEAGGSIPFSRFMERVLYAPGLGYYSAGSRKFGAAGDFVTAPELGPLFALGLAGSCAAALQALGGGDLLELGAGSGALAAGLLNELARRDALPGRYLILEPSAELRQRQRQRLAADCPQFAARVEWLDAPPRGLRGVLLANEVVDALPVELFRWRSAGAERGRVGWEAGGFVLDYQPDDSPAFAGPLAALAAECGLAEGYRSEFRPQLPAWLAGLAEGFEGAMLFIDYGHPRREYYHPQRAQGTLMCHYRHRAHADPLCLPGLQDITAYVDFTALAEAGAAAGLEVQGFCTQAHLLLDNGIEQRLAVPADPADPAYLAEVQQLKTLLLPGEMGERFKCLLLGRGLPGGLPGFRLQDLRSRL
ncbi:SAM-dependent methyltransferase [Thiohalobacter sp. IOR34]|uniref:class I SAM-dependent methyltransferase n=1 Tax=Thiohalobacter sp. IOR34 TaxID=3057176 RepID=UPI0025B1754A|nr:SAM-dependent methyltransferase [Thiohalobacter sp. IOR34]WJW75370.1 SAM-dependent methyltransferase [Thiohalobacter sp. IOR34]